MADPILNEFYYLGVGVTGDTGDPPDQDTNDDVAAEGIVIALVNGTLEMSQTWERLDA